MIALMQVAHVLDVGMRQQGMHDLEGTLNAQSRTRNLQVDIAPDHQSENRAARLSDGTPCTQEFDHVQFFQYALRFLLQEALTVELQLILLRL